MEILICYFEIYVVMFVGEVGEICVWGYFIMLEYNDNLEVIEKIIDMDGWFYMGDFGIMDECGYVKVMGWVKEMIIRGGENLFLVEIENVMFEYFDIFEVVVVGIFD